MNALETFLAMGGYGLFVWPSYLLTVAVLAAVLALSVRARRRARRTLAALRDRSPGRGELRRAA